MRKLLFTSLGIVVIFLFILSLFSVELNSATIKPFFDIRMTPEGPDVCGGKPLNCSSEGIIITPPGGNE